MGRRVAIATIVAALAAAGAAPAATGPGFSQYGGSAAHTGVAPGAPAASSAGGLHPVWSVPVSGGADGSGPEPSPVVADATVYAGSPGGVLYALDRTTGAVRWSITLHAGASLSTPAVARGTVYVGVGAPVDDLTAVSAATGAVRWSRHTDASGWVDAPTVAAGRVFVGTGLPGQAQAGSEYAYTTAGGRLWRHRIARAGGALSPAVAGGVAYAAAPGDFASVPSTQPGRLVAFAAATGHRLWTRAPAVGAFQSPAVSGGRVFVAGSGGVAAYTPGGTSLWQRTFGGALGGLFTTPAVAHGRVFVGSEEGPCPCALSAATGRVLWRDPAAQGDQFSPATVGGGAVYVVDEGTLEALAAGTGHVLFASAAATGGQPAAANGMLFTEGSAVTAWAP
jgi:outer membrane protein assembly factor BamB